MKIPIYCRKPRQNHLTLDAAGCLGCLPMLKLTLDAAGCLGCVSMPDYPWMYWISIDTQDDP